MGSKDGGAIYVCNENLDIGFSTDEGVYCGGVKRLQELKIIKGCASMKFGLELLFDVTVVSRIIGGDGNFEFLGEATKVLDEFDGEGTLDNIPTGLSGQFDGLASKVA